VLGDVDLLGSGGEGVDAPEPGALGQAAEVAAVEIAEPERLVGPGQDREDHDGGGDQQAKTQQDPAAPRMAAGAARAVRGRRVAVVVRWAGLGDRHPRASPLSRRDGMTIHQISHKAAAGIARILRPNRKGLVAGYSTTPPTKTAPVL